MDKSTFERLLYESEGTTLDFKSEQYVLDKKDPGASSELIKDILGFANSWRRSEAFILIGVKERVGERAEVVGILPQAHLPDHTLQQFVSNKLNKPVQFQYESLKYEGKQVGVIRIDLQQRPLFLKKDYGQLKAGGVYVRRGSSTDPTRPADPDEISQMGEATALHHAELRVEFADPMKEDSIGTQLSLQTELCHMPDRKEIPDFGSPQSTSPFGNFLSTGYGNKPNTAFYREFAQYESYQRAVRAVRFLVQNTGGVVARNVRVEITSSLRFIDSVDLSDFPDRKLNYMRMPNIAGLHTTLNPPPGRITIESQEENTGLVVIECDDLQPGRRIWSELIYVGAGRSQRFGLSGVVYADNLPKPVRFELGVAMEVTERKISVDELIELADTD